MEDLAAFEATMCHKPVMTVKAEEHEAGGGRSSSAATSTGSPRATSSAIEGSGGAAQELPAKRRKRWTGMVKEEFLESGSLKAHPAKPPT